MHGSRGDLLRVDIRNAALEVPAGRPGPSAARARSTHLAWSTRYGLLQQTGPPRPAAARQNDALTLGLPSIPRAVHGWLSLLAFQRTRLPPNDLYGAFRQDTPENNAVGCPVLDFHRARRPGVSRNFHLWPGRSQRRRTAGDCFASGCQGNVGHGPFPIPAEKVPGVSRTLQGDRSRAPKRRRLEAGQGSRSEGAGNAHRSLPGRGHAPRALHWTCSAFFSSLGLAKSTSLGRTSERNLAHRCPSFLCSVEAPIPSLAAPKKSRF